MARRIAAIGAALGAARRFARKNPQKTQSYLDKAADFADKQTKGKYSSQIRSASDKASQAALGGDQGGTTSSTPPPSSS
ncbi:hypothetical protein SGUI_2015 [Serinicoccus hydrothermalis]|uniref:Antitoxin n=1 Tax=Serinicoccus hydrothermalis TaxID=1758689 RepID=A0A1B1NDE5_9MICO|nr:antitoxin [Serinicoccus hydrothermalis]ANS79411.1 hypothetical protein SGUI_2015 [Serinicoccus hydrothermalis]